MEFLAPIAPYYYSLYWFIVMLMTVSRFNVMRRNSAYEVIETQDVYRSMVVFVTFYIIFFGFRPIADCFGDTVVYHKSFLLLQNFGVFDLQGTESRSSDVLFYAFQKFCSMIMDVHLWFASIMFFYITMMFWGCKKIDYQHGALLMLFCIGAFEFYSYSVNLTLILFCNNKAVCYTAL